MSEASLKYLTSSLQRAGGRECADAVDLIGSFLETHALIGQRDAEHALYQAIWGHLGRALDHGDFDANYREDLDAIEAEMAGHVLSCRLARGWLVRAPDAPVEFRSIQELIEQHKAADIQRQ